MRLLRAAVSNVWPLVLRGQKVCTAIGGIRSWRMLANCESAMHTENRMSKMVPQHAQQSQIPATAANYPARARAAACFGAISLHQARMQVHARTHQRWWVHPLRAALRR
jgi:hypothetical protein